MIPENKSIPDGSLVVGAPGKVIKQLSNKQIEGLKAGAEHYVKNSDLFKEDMLPVHASGEDESGRARSKL